MMVIMIVATLMTFSVAMREMIVYLRPAGHFCLLATPPEH